MPNTKKFKILYLVTNSNIGGAQTHLYELISDLKDKYEIEVVTGDEGYLSHACNGIGIRVHILESIRRNSNPLRDFAALFEIYHLIRAIRPNIVHSHTFKAGVLGRFAAFFARVPSVYTLHAWLWNTKEFLEFFSSWFCDRVITVSDAGKKLLIQQHISPSKVITIHNGVFESNAQVVHCAKDAPIVMMVARFTQAKDFETLLRAFSLIPEGPRLRLVGDGHTRPAVEALIAELKIADRVELLGERADVDHLLLQSDILVLSSFTEMFPICILEAMRAGLPVIATNVGGIQEAVIDQQTGLLVSPSSINEMADALNKLCFDADLRKCMGSAGRSHYEQFFTASVMRRNVISLYESLLNADTSSGA